MPTEPPMFTFLLALALACSTNDAPAPQPVASAPLEAAAEAAQATPAAGTTAQTVDAACLHKADLADGKEDTVVQKCTNCGFVMDGDAAQASQHAGMTFHACSESCKLTFDKEPDAVLARVCGKS